MGEPETKTEITSDERRIRSERLKSRLMGICEGFDAGASVDVKAQEEEISRLEQQLEAANQRIAELSDSHRACLAEIETRGEACVRLSNRAEAAERKLATARIAFVDITHEETLRQCKRIAFEEIARIDASALAQIAQQEECNG